MIEAQRQIVSGLTVEQLADVEGFANDLTSDTLGVELGGDNAIRLFHSDLSEKMFAYINNADSIACLAPIIAGPDLVTHSNRGIYKKGNC